MLNVSPGVRGIVPIVCLCVLVSGCGGALRPGSVGGSSGTPETSAVEAQACSGSAENAPAVTVNGGSEMEQAAARAALAPLARYSRIAAIEFSQDGRTVTVRWDGTQRAEQAEADWQTQLIAPCLAANVLAVQPDLERVALAGPGGGSTYVPGNWPQMLVASDLDPQALARLEGRFDVRAISLIALPSGTAVRAVIRLREDQLFDDSAHDWNSIMLGSKYPYFLSVEAPDGTAVDISSRIVSRAGEDDADWFGGDTFEIVPMANEPVPAYLNGPTDLHVTIAAPGKPDMPFHIVCQPSPQGIADAASICEHLLTDRWALFVPQGGIPCPGPVGTTVLIRGTLGGVHVDTGYDTCYGEAVTRWLRLLGVPPTT